MAERRLRKIDVLQRQLPAAETIDQVRQIATSLNLMKDRYMARPAAELMVERGDPDGERLRAGLAATPVLGRDPHGDLLRAAFKQAFAKEGIPHDVEGMARAFYATRGQKEGTRTPPAQGDDWIAKSDEGGVLGSIRKLFGR